MKLTDDEIKKAYRKLANTSSRPEIHVAAVIALCDEILASRLTPSEKALTGCDVCGAEPGRCMTATICQQERERHDKPERPSLPCTRPDQYGEAVPAKAFWEWRDYALKLESLVEELSSKVGI